MESVLGLVRHPGNDALFRAMEMSLLATLAGHPLHIHAEGLRGTGKTTIMRAVRRMLPRIRRISGCLYNCDPAAPHCPAHRGLDPQRVLALGEEWVPMPYLEISHSAKIGTVVGSVDLGRLVSHTQPEAALLPGTIPQAHRGIIFVDEINRLAETSPELADVLLDVMGTKPGRVQIEETGLPAVELPVQVSVWAASNPDEDPGPLEEVRRQLSDRFDFAIYTDRPGDAETVERILAMGERAGSRPAAVAETQAELWRTRLNLRAAELRRVETPAALRQQIAGLYSKFDLESLRAVQAIQAGIRLAACLENRGEAVAEDLHRVVPMALRHRVDPETIRKVTAHLGGEGEKAEAPGALGRSRFPGLSFGGVVAEQSPPPAPAPAAMPVRPAAPAPAPGGPRPPGPAAAQPGPDGPSEGESWLRRTLSQLGLGRPGEQPGSQAGRLDRFDRPGRYGGAQPGVQPPGLTAPRRPEERAPAPDRPGGTGQAGARPSPAGAHPPGGSGPAQLPNPVEHPPEAPPNRARPLSHLRPEEWVRTEEELGRP
ncbi:MAG: magnesium chelatase [Bacillota bacterium]